MDSEVQPVAGVVEHGGRDVVEVSKKGYTTFPVLKLFTVFGQMWVIIYVIM